MPESISNRSNSPLHNFDFEIDFDIKANSLAFSKAFFILLWQKGTPSKEIYTMGVYDFADQLKESSDIEATISRLFDDKVADIPSLIEDATSLCTSPDPEEFVKTEKMLRKMESRLLDHYKISPFSLSETQAKNLTSMVNTLTAQWPVFLHSFERIQRNRAFETLEQGFMYDTVLDGRIKDVFSRMVQDFYRSFEMNELLSDQQLYTWMARFTCKEIETNPKNWVFTNKYEVNRQIYTKKLKLIH